MEPTLQTNNVLLTEHISPRLQWIKRGDIIVAMSPTDPRQGNSTDSRTYGPVPQGLIRGRAVCRVWPPQDVRMLTATEDS
ncbi:hypothetical protein B566_EDAN017600 [Ephemera danica]|nr:hypothetical protein B566_EDAN017600 [Ephemera danica]